MHHQTISLDLAGVIIADLEVTEDRIDGLLYAVEGWHPDLGRVVVIEGSAEAVLVLKVPLHEECSRRSGWSYTHDLVTRRLVEWPPPSMTERQISPESAASRHLRKKTPPG